MAINKTVREIIILLGISLILALAALPSNVLAQEGAQSEPGPWIFTFYGTEYTIPSVVAAHGIVDTNVEVGYYDASTDDSPDMAAEYYDTDSGPTVNATVASHGDSGSIQFVAAYQSEDTNAAALDFDIKRTWRSKKGCATQV